MTNQTEQVLILGGGVIGLSCALYLLQAGRSVRILEKNLIGAATSHANCGTITPSHALPLAGPGMISKALKYMTQADAPFYIKPSTDLNLLEWLLRFSLRCNAKDQRRAAFAKAALLNASRQSLQSLIEKYNLDCQFQASGVMYVCKSQMHLDELSTELALLKECGVSSEPIGGMDLAQREPALLPGMAGGVFFPGDAHFKPDSYCAELQRMVLQLGGVIDESCEVLGLQADGDLITQVETSKGPRCAPQILLALASWSPALLKTVELSLPVQPGKGYSITYTPPGMVPKTPLVLTERSVCVTAWRDGYRLGSTMEFSGFDDKLNAKRLAALERGAHEYLHEPFGEEVKQRWFGWRPMTYDDLPILGRSPRHANLFIATGHGMLGMSMSAITGQLLAELICGQQTAIDLAPYSPARF